MYRMYKKRHHFATTGSGQTYVGKALNKYQCVFSQDFTYAQLCATQSRLSVLHLKDSADGLFWHGVDAKTVRETPFLGDLISYR